MAITIVTNHWQEDLNWLKKSKFPVVVIDKEGAAPSDFAPQFVVPNVAHALPSWFKYIIENYDNLPGHVAFIHGHEYSNHQKHSRHLLEVIEGANIEKYEFISLNNVFKKYAFADETDFMQIWSYWEHVFRIPFEKPKDYAMGVIVPGAQAIVSRNRIRRFSKYYYEFLYKMVTKSRDPWIPHNMEALFHIFFGEPWECPSPQDWFLFEHTQVWESNEYNEYDMKNINGP
jgi:hypothetical protein